MAIDQETGDVYVADTGNGRVQQFSSAGTFIRAFGPLTSPTFIAIDNSTGPSKGDVYVVDTATSTIYKFDATGAPISGWGAGGKLTESSKGFPFGELAGVAVGPSGDLYVVETGGNVTQYDQAAKFIAGLIYEGGNIKPNGLAVSSAGELFAVRQSGVIQELDESGEFGQVSLYSPLLSPHGVAVDASSGELIADLDTSLRSYQFTPGGEVLRSDSTPSGCSPSPSLGCEATGIFGMGDLSSGAGIAINSSSKAVFVADAGANELLEFSPTLVPDAGTEPATALQRTTATLNGVIGAAGGPDANCHFEYVDNATYEAEEFKNSSTVPCSPSGPFSGSGLSAVSAEITGLSLETKYRYRLVGVNENGENFANTSSFITLPAVSLETLAASSIGKVAATLNGSINPHGVELEECVFEYVDSATFAVEEFAAAQKEPCAETPAEIGSGEDPVSVHADVTGLSVDTSYYFRLRAKNSFGNSFGSGEGFIVEFRTLPAVNLQTLTATDIAKDGATLNGEVDPEGVELDECLFEYVDQATFESSQFASAQTKPCAEAPAEIGSGEDPTPVHADVTGLSPNTIYHFRLAATNSFGTSQAGEKTLETHGPPTIAGTEASEVTTTTAKVSAQINPHGEATAFQVEYLTEAAYEANEPSERFAGATIVPVPAEGIGAGVSPLEASRQLSGLSPDTAYRFRLVAGNVAGALQGPGGRFVTFLQPGSSSCPANEALRGGASAALPDCRAYEMVTPAQKIGEPFPPEPVEDLAGKGSCHTKDGVSCVPGETSSLSPIQSSPDGNALAYMGQPLGAGLAPGLNAYLANRDPGSGWGSQGLSSPRFIGSSGQGYKAFSADLSRAVIYQSAQLTPDAPAQGGVAFPNLYLRQGGSLQPLVADPPPNRSAGAAVPNEFVARYYGANAGTPTTQAFSHVVFAANDALTGASAFAPASPAVPAGTSAGCSVGNNCNLYEWADGQLRLVNVRPGNSEVAAGAVIGSRLEAEEPADVDHAISDDGSRIFWSAPSGQVFVRISGEETRKIEDPFVRFLTASADGSKALLGDGCLYDVDAEACTDLTGGNEGFEGILGGSEDLSRIYFVDTAVLSPDQNANGEEATAGMDNLYLWQGGEVTYIGTLRGEDSGVFSLSRAYGTWNAAPSRRTAQVSNDGRYLAFMSAASLTGYDNTVREGNCVRQRLGSRCAEVFEYDAAGDSLACASCNPSGQRPIGGSNLSLFGWNPPFDGGTTLVPQNLTTDGQGRLFFESKDALSSHDENAPAQDVYQWEPNGVGSCTKANGCVSLISSGHAADDSFFLSSTPSGNDAFFLTREQLVAKDKDEMLDIYDARVSGGIDENTAPPCLGEACKGQGTTAPPQQSPGSGSFSGPGNEKPHKHKKKRKKHAHKHQSHKRAAKHGKGGSK